MANKKIKVYLYCALDHTTLAVEDISEDKDTLNVLQFAASRFWNLENFKHIFCVNDTSPKDYEPVLYKDGVLLNDYTNKCIKDLGIADSSWLGVGWRRIDRNNYFMILNE